jgi:hypothetical protein
MMNLNGMSGDYDYLRASSSSSLLALLGIK